jgi:mono/diheme cytochrome c family protein
MPMPLRTLAAGAIAFAAAATAPGVHATPPLLGELDSVALGRNLAARNCGMCHALDRTGPSPNPQAPPFRALGDRFDVDLLGEGLATGILTEHPAMPQFRFEPYEVVAIVRYLRSVQDRQPI